MHLLCGVRPNLGLYYVTSGDQGRSFEGQGDSQSPSSFLTSLVTKFTREGKFLRRFIPNYVELTLEFMWLLKKGSEFVWDTTAKKYFEALKQSLTHTPLLFSPNYSRDYFLYLAASDYTITMVLVQEDDSHYEHVIYYLSQSLMTTETKYLHV